MTMKKTVFACIALLLSCHTWAGIAVSSTRVIYPSDQQSVNVSLSNLLDQPALAQVWVDNGDPNIVPAANQNPFLLTPPVSRLHAKGEQVIRVILKPNFSLAQDRESLYWFNMLDIPPIAKENQNKNQIQLSVRSRLKLFYRPTTLNMTQQQAFTALEFRKIQNAEIMEIENPSPYYITLNSMQFKGVQKDQKYQADLMLEPFSKQTLKKFPVNSSMNKVIYEVINDLGSNVQFSAEVK